MAQTTTVALAAHLRLQRTVKLGWDFDGRRLRWKKPSPGELDLGEVHYDLEDDPSALLSRFLAIERGDMPALFEFLQQTGIWDCDKEEHRPEDIWREQDRLRAIVTRKKLDNEPPDELLSDGLESVGRLQTLFLVPNRREPSLIEIFGHDTKTALYIAVWLEWATGVKRAYCARPDCPEHRPGRAPYELTRADKRYCSQYCAHLESLRSTRAARQRRRHA